MDYLSCVPQILYRDGGFFEHPELLFRLCEPAATPQGECRMLAEIFPPFQIVRPMPDLLVTQGQAFHASLLEHYALYNRDCGRGAASAVVALAGATLHANVLYTTSAAGFRPVYETHRPNDRPYVPLIAADVAAAEATDLSDPDIVHFFIGSAGSSNYGHWLVDDLPRIKALPALRQAAGSRRIRVWITGYGDPIDRVRVETLQHLCRGQEGIEVGLLRIDRVYRFDTLHYATPVSYHPLLKSPAALAFLAGSVGADQGAGRAARIFVTRRADRSRALLNIEAVAALLAARGFTTVDVEGMDFAAQAQTFAAARIVVGCMGAAMTNCLFAAPGATTLYLGPEGWIEPFYWDVAAMRGHRYMACYGPVQDPAVPAHLNSYTIPLATLDRALEGALGGSLSPPPPVAALSAS